MRVPSGNPSGHDALLLTAQLAGDDNFSKTKRDSINIHITQTTAVLQKLGFLVVDRREFHICFQQKQLIGNGHCECGFSFAEAIITC